MADTPEPITYRWTDADRHTVVRSSDGAFIPADEENADYLAALAAGIGDPE